MTTSHRSIVPRSHSSRGDRNNSNAESLRAMQQRLETRQTLKEGLVDRPLNQFAGKFIVHLLRELWNQDYYLRCGLALLGIGFIMQMLTFAMIGNDIARVFFRYIFVILLLGGSYLYLYRPDEFLLRIARFVSTSSASETFFRTLESLDPTQLRRICFVALISPTLLEMKAITFLAAILVESGWLINVFVAVSASFYLYYVRKKERLTPRECSLRGLLFLKASALLVTIVFTRDIRRLNALAGPFIIAAGAMLISNHPALAGDEFDWLSRAVRHALRLTLRDVLGDIGQNVGENEMLKLAMIRWLVDYWSGNGVEGGDTAEERSTVGSTASQPEQAETAPTASTTVSLTGVDVGIRDEAPAARSAETSITITRSSQSAGPERPSAPSQQQLPPTPQIVSANADHDIQWNELWTMLSMTTDQMLGEANNPSDQSEADTNDHEQDGNGSIENLKAMLESLDVDGRAKPAVQAYKATIEDIPPSRNLAIALSIARRCPALLALLSWYCVGSYDSICATITLLPCIWMEIERLKEWSESCHRAVRMESSASDGSESTSKEQTDVWIPQEIEPMTILLSPDTYSPYLPTSSLQVWANVKASAGALETGLTAVRAAHTTVAATELTFDVVNLAQFGVEVYKKGLLHGTAMIARDVCHFLAADADGQQARQRRRHGRYTAAAVNAARNSHVVARNVTILMEEEGGRQVVDNAVGAVMPAVDALTFVVGKGWLWGKDATEESSPVAAETTCTAVKDEANAEVVPESTDVDNTEETVESIDARDDTNLTVDAKVEEIPDETKPSAIDNASEPVEDEMMTAETMQLMADALEKGIITEGEKDRFVEMIIGNKSAVEGIKKSLECLLAENASGTLNDAEDRTSETMSAADDQEKAAQSSPIRKQQQIIVEGAASDDSTSGGATDSDGALASVPLEASGFTSTDSWAPADDRLNSDEEVNAVDKATSSSRVCSTPIKTNVSAAMKSGQVDDADTVEHVRTVDFSADAFDADAEEDGNDDDDDNEDEGSWTQIDSNGLPRLDHDDVASAQLGPFDNQQSLRSRTEGSAAASASSSSQREGNQGDDWMKWVGGRLAVAGAVIGSIALANQNNDDGQESNRSRSGTDGASRGRRRSDDKKSSSVTIELLDSDDNAD